MATVDTVWKAIDAAGSRDMDDVEALISVVIMDTTGATGAEARDAAIGIMALIREAIAGPTPSQGHATPDERNRT